MKKVKIPNKKTVTGKVTPQKLDLPKAGHSIPTEYAPSGADLALLGGTEPNIKAPPRRRS
jgi:hypothetical protein